LAEKILLIAFRFPPYSKVGAFRWAKLAGRLAARGHELHVLTVPWMDMGHTEWLADVEHPNVVIHRTSSGFPHRLKNVHLPPRLAFVRNGAFHYGEKLLGSGDEAQFWGRHLLRAGERVVREHGIRTIIATSPPYNTAYWASELKARCPGTKLIQDFRDPWFSSEREMREAPAAWRARFETAVKRADLIVGVTDEMAALLGKLSGGKPTVCLPNGVDLKEVVTYKSDALKSVDFSYIGSINRARQVALNVFLDWIRERERQGKRMTVSVIGTYPAALPLRYADLEKNGLLRLGPPVAQSEALRLVASSRVALHVNGPDVNATQISTKLIEHAALGVPTLSVNYGGAVERLIRERDLGWSLHAEDPELHQKLDTVLGDTRTWGYRIDDLDFDAAAAAYERLIERVR
jgi:glycosyltransferase involved in cell wall biosynthesis